MAAQPSARAESWCNQLTADFEELQASVTALEEMQASTAWRAPGLPGVHELSAAQTLVLSKVDSVRLKLVEYDFGGQLRLAHFGNCDQPQLGAGRPFVVPSRDDPQEKRRQGLTGFLLTDTALRQHTLFPPHLRFKERAASLYDVQQLLLANLALSETMRMNESIVISNALLEVWNDSMPPLPAKFLEQLPDEGCRNKPWRLVHQAAVKVGGEKHAVLVIAAEGSSSSSDPQTQHFLFSTTVFIFKTDIHGNSLNGVEEVAQTHSGHGFTLNDNGYLELVSRNPTGVDAKYSRSRVEFPGGQEDAELFFRLIRVLDGRDRYSKDGLCPPFGAIGGSEGGIRITRSIGGWNLPTLRSIVGEEAIDEKLHAVASKRRGRLGLLGDVLFSADIESQNGGGSDETDSEEKDAYSKISTKFGTSDTMSSLCSRIMSVSLPMLTQAVRHFGTRPDNCLQPDVLGPILEAIPNLIGKLNRIRRAAAESADLLVRVVVTTPAGFELMSQKEVVTPIASSPTIAKTQKELQEFLSREGRSRRARADRVLKLKTRSGYAVKFCDFQAATGEKLQRIIAAPPSSSVEGRGVEGRGEEDRSAIPDPEMLRWPSKVETPHKMREHFPHVLFAEEVDGPCGSGVLALALGLQWDWAGAVYGRQNRKLGFRQRLRLRLTMWFMPMLGTSRGAPAGAGASNLREWSDDRLDHFMYRAGSLLDVGRNRYLFRAGSAAAKAAYEKLQQFRKLDNCCIVVHWTSGQRGKHAFGEMLDEHGWMSLSDDGTPPNMDRWTDEHEWSGTSNAERRASMDEYGWSWEVGALNKMSECGAFDEKGTRRVIEAEAALAELKQKQTEKFGDFIDAFADDRSVGRISFRVF